ncbi:MAG: regulatory protein RecX [Actinomycetota bacterium]
MYPNALERALKLLAAHSRSRREVAGRLERAGFPSEVVARVEDRLVELGLLEDRAYARDWAERAVARGGLAPEAVREVLLEKGVGAQEVDRALEEVVGQTCATELAIGAGRRRLRELSSLDPRQSHRRLAGFLMGKGYEPEVADEACRRLLGRGD